MLPAEEVVLGLEEAARTDGPRVFVSGRLRIDVEWVHDMGQHFYRVGGVGAYRGQVIKAIEAARQLQSVVV